MQSKHRETMFEEMNEPEVQSMNVVLDYFLL